MRDKTEKAEQNTSSRKNGQPKNRVKTNISQGSTKEPKAADLTAALRSAAELNDVIHRFLRTRGAVFEAAAEAVAACLRDGGKIFLFGNGGSAAQAQHFAAELVNGLSRRDSPPLPAVALTTDMSALTAIGNDRGFAEVFGRQVEALGWPGDVALGLTTSGTSPNILEGLRGARAKGMITIALTGENTAAVGPLTDYVLDAPSCSTARIQEAHLFLLHELARRLERASF